MLLFFCLSFVFIFILKLFLRVTASISRQQEMLADEIAAAVIGKEDYIKNLANIQKQSDIYDRYVCGEFAQLTCKEFLPPMMQGFAILLDSPTVEHFATLQHDDAHDPYIDHPVHKLRAAAIRAANIRIRPVVKLDIDDNLPATSLIPNFDAVDETLTHRIFADEIQDKKITPIRWDETFKNVYLPLWQKKLAPYRDVLRDVALAQLPQLLTNSEHLKARFATTIPSSVSDELFAEETRRIFGAALSLTLYEEGYKGAVLPGHPVRFERDGFIVHPFRLVNAMTTENSDANEWNRITSTLSAQTLCLSQLP